MSTPTEKPLQDVFNHTNVLANIHGKLQQLARLNELWQQTTPVALAQNSQVANWRDRCLIIELKSSTWATRLQYAIPDLLEQLRQHQEFKDLLTIDWYINPTVNFLSFPTAIPPPALSTHSAQLLQETAKHIASEPLKNALQKLAANNKFALP